MVEADKYLGGNGRRYKCGDYNIQLDRYFLKYDDRMRYGIRWGTKEALDAYRAAKKRWAQNNKHVSKAYYRENRAKIWEKELRQRYGITGEQYQKLFREQRGRCAICCTEKCASGNRLSVDHCHKSAKIRGLLCGHCNTGLGKFMDNPDLLKRAIQYLQK